jgi:hypothetical protein
MKSFDPTELKTPVRGLGYETVQCAGLRDSNERTPRRGAELAALHQIVHQRNCDISIPKVE